MSKPVYVSDGIRWNTSGQVTPPVGRDPFLQPFRSDSIWNLPISVDVSTNNAYSDITDASLVDLINPNTSLFVNASPNEFTHPVYRASAGDPWAYVHDETNQVGDFQAGGKWGYKIPVSAFPDEGTDSSMGVFSADKRFVYEWHGIIKTGPSEYRSWRQPTEAYFDSQNPILYDATTQTVTFASSTGLVSRSGHELEDQAPIVFSQPTVVGQFLPPEVNAGQTYYVHSPAANNFRISQTAGGAAMTFSQNGNGRFCMGDGSRMVVQKMYEGSDPLEFRDTLGGFNRGSSYYIVDSQIDQDTNLVVFSLSTSVGGQPITPTASGYIRLMPIEARKQTKGRVVRVDTYGSGLGPDGGSRAFEGSVHGGLVRQWEIEAGEIKHALAMACGKAQMRYDSGEAGYNLNSVSFTLGSGSLTLNDHGFEENREVYILNAPSGSGISYPAIYYAKNVTANTLGLASTSGGNAITLSGSGTVTARHPEYAYGTDLGYVWPATANDSGCADAYGIAVSLNCISGSPTITVPLLNYSLNSSVRVYGLPSGANFSQTSNYYVRDLTSNSFSLASSSGGTGIAPNFSATFKLRRATVDATDIVVTATSGNPILSFQAGYQNGDAVRTSATVPDGSNIAANTTYFARDVSGNTLSLAATQNGAAISPNFTSTISVRRFGSVRMGQYFAIPWSIDVESLNLTDSGKVLARAFQHYGAYVTDTAQETFVMCFIEKRSGVFDENDPTIYFRNQLKAGADANNNWLDLNIIRSELRRVTNNTKLTPNGGSLSSQRRAPLAEDLVP